MKYQISFILFFMYAAGYGQVSQPLRYELEKKNTDDFFTVLPAGEHGLVVLRDTDDYDRKDGNLWQITVLDTLLKEIATHEIGIDAKYVFKGYDFSKNRLFLLFREGTFAKSNFHVITINVVNSEVHRFDIENEIELELSHMIVVNNSIILGGYVRLSPTLVSYQVGEDKLGVIPGYFKDRSSIMDLKVNDNGTFNVLTIEKEYAGFYLKLRTYTPEGDILFEKSLIMDDDYKALDGKSTDFVNGNIAITGTYATGGNTSAQGIYFSIVKPDGQKNQIKYYDFPDLEHFFDYKGPKRAARIKRKIADRISKGREFKYSSRLFMHEVQESEGGYLVAAEIFDPKYDQIGGSGYYSPFNTYNQYHSGFGNAVNQRYVRRPSGVRNVEEANHFKYHESIILRIDKSGNLDWDNSLPLEDVEAYSLEPVMDFNKDGDFVNLVYKSDEKVNFKIIKGNETLASEAIEIKLKHEEDEVKHNYEGIGKAEYWYGNHFLVWGYHRVANKMNTAVDDKRNVLFINKLTFEN